MSAFLDITERIQLIKDKIKKDARSEGTVEPTSLPPPGAQTPMHKAEVVTAPVPPSAAAAVAAEQPTIRFQDQSRTVPAEDLSGVEPLQVAEVLRFVSYCFKLNLDDKVFYI